LGFKILEIRTDFPVLILATRNIISLIVAPDCNEI